MPPQDTRMARNYIETSPHQLSSLCVVRASRAIGDTVADPAQWFLVIADLHRALKSALVAALRGRPASEPIYLNFDGSGSIILSRAVRVKLSLPTAIGFSRFSIY